MKTFEFLIHSNLVIALSAGSLSLASEVQLGWEPYLHPYLAVVFFATLADYNYHRIISLIYKPKAVLISKYTWASGHLLFLKILLVFSCTGLLISLFFAGGRNLFFLTPLAAFTLIYSLPSGIKYARYLQIKRIPGIKTLLLAIVWSSVTVFLPVINSEFTASPFQILILFAQRLTFIFAIAIPFDIRDIEYDSKNGIKTIPVIFGEKAALLISGFALLLSLAFAFISYSENQTDFVFMGYLISIIVSGIAIFSKRLQSKKYYHHGILDGSVLLHGALLIICFYF